MNKFLLSTILSVIFIYSYGQESKLYHNFKIGIFSEYSTGPATLRGNILEGNYYYSNNSSVALGNIIYTLRYNIFEHSNNLGVGVNISPSLGLSFSEDAFASINLPAYLTLNYGAGATYSSTSDYGVYIGVGYEFTNNGLVILDNGNDIMTWSEPMVIFGFRYWTKSFKLIEISLKYGKG